MLQFREVRASGVARLGLHGLDYNPTMSSLDTLFETRPFSHPKIRSWTHMLRSAAGSARCEVLRRREGLSFQPARIYVHFSSEHTEDEQWDAALNDFLIQEKVRAVDQENEELRFSLMLRERLKRPESRFGDGFYNAVLVAVVEEFFKQDERVKGKLALLDRGNPHKQGAPYSDCVEMIEAALASCARELSDDLGYGRSTAERVLAGAVDMYLDDRFSLTNRKLLGLV